jgi:very-short-patch-repair endonuclease
VIDPAARARLERWKLSLLDLSAGNRLLDAARTRTGVPLPGADVVRLAAALAAGDAFSLEAAPEAGAAPGAAGPATGGLALHRLAAPLAPAELARRLTTLRRTARAQLADGGVHTLWLALGLLHWCDADGVAHPAPLWLYPVELERTDGGGLQLASAGAVEPRFNQTLGEKLRRELEVLLEPPVTEAGEVDLAALLETAEGIAVTRPGWRVERAALLGVFSFAKFVMWNDLDARAEELLASPVVAHLAAGGGVAFAQPSGEAAAAVTEPVGAAAAADLLCPLDADASQLAAVAAAGAGASFVLQGPPGTGKSQTIANLIVHLVSAGKTVLLVTEKIAALEVVNQRLAAVGLGEFCLELHSHKAGRAQVLAHLGRVLDRAFRPGSGPSGDDARLAELRDALDAHARAMHRAGPFGRSVHEVLGRLVELRTTPRAALAERDAVGLDAATFERRRLAVAALAAAAVPVEPVATHPWRLSTLERWPLDGRERVLAAVDEAAAAAAALADTDDEGATRVPGLVARTREQLAALGALAALAGASPRPGAELLTQLRAVRDGDLGEQIALIRAKGGGTLEPPRDPLAFLLLANRHRVLATEVDDRFTDRVAELDAPALWAQLKRWSGSVAPVRYLALRGVRAEVRAAAIPGQLDVDAAMQAALEAVIAERAARAALRAAAEPARRWFGELGGDPLALDLGKLDAAVGWAAELRRAFDAVEVAGGDAGRAAAWRALVAQVAAQAGEPAGDLAPFGRLAAAVARWAPALAALAEVTGIDPADLGRAAAGADHLAALRDQLDGLRHAIDAHRDWVAFHAARRAAVAAGVGPAVAAIERGDLGAAELALAWERATLLAWADAELADTPALARFHGATHHAHVAAFADLDRAMLALVRSRALGRLAERVPRVTADPGGELGLLLHELKKQRGHRPLRRLFAEIPTLLPRLAPCMLMSPLSVAQFLDPALPRFDVVVFDEASQLPTADAIGALARGAAAVVVGDGRQLPPTRFFEAAAGDPDDDDAPVELESVLDDCVAARLPELRLQWHYRSRHEDLIAFANRRYYGDRLQVFPAAQASPDLGISWRRVPGVYDRGRTRGNRIEAEAVVAELVARLKDPAQCSRSLAVVTFSRAQQELIEDLLDEARAADPALDAVIELLGRTGIAATEPLLVKNLETVQGDERDVVLLSVGYGPDETGAFTMGFGPLSQRGGERRLNVAITRAREQLVLFSSFDPEDIAETAAQPARDLAELLAFARAGGGAARPAEGEPAASPIMLAMARALAERGHRVRHQIGCGAYKIDLAVVDPGDPDRYILAIEHDGAAYASAAAARDRDRLRAQVLAGLGWRLHRVWSLDWWADPERETQRAHAALVTALAANRQRRASAGRPASGPVAAAPAAAPAARKPAGSAPAARKPAGSAPVPRAPAATPGAGSTGSAGGAGSARAPGATGAGALLAAGSAPIRIPRGGIPIGPYTAAAIPAGRRVPDDLFAPRHLQELGKIVEQVLAAEAPIHVDLLARRVGAYFGIGRITQRVAEQVRHAIDGRGRWGDEQDFVWRMDQDPSGVPPVRVAGSGPTGRREIDEVPLSEIAAAIRIVVERAVGIGQRELVRDAARLLGFSRITDRVTERIADALELAAHRELIRVDGGRATLPPLD